MSFCDTDILNSFPRQLQLYWTCERKKPLLPHEKQMTVLRHLHILFFFFKVSEPRVTKRWFCQPARRLTLKRASNSCRTFGTLQNKEIRIYYSMKKNIGKRKITIKICTFTGPALRLNAGSGCPTNLFIDCQKQRVTFDNAVLQGRDYSMVEYDGAFSGRT